MQFTIQPNRTSMGMANMATGGFTSDNTAVEVNIGFRPRHVKLFNATDATAIEKTDTMPASATFQTVTAGAQTVQTSNQIVLTDNGFTISAAAAGNAKALHFIAQD